MNNTRQPSASHKMNFNEHFSQHSFTANFSNCRPKFNVWNGISRVKKITYNFHDESIRLLVALHEVISFFSILVRRISKISISKEEEEKERRRYPSAEPREASSIFVNSRHVFYGEPI